MFHPSNVYTNNGHLVIKMEPLEAHELEHERLEHEREEHLRTGLHIARTEVAGDWHHGGNVHHREHGELVHDAIPNLDHLQDQLERPHGHLEPRHDLINEHSRDYHV